MRLLRDSGVQTAMLTGDNKFTADAVARQLGIDTVIAEVLPEDKANEVKKLQALAGRLRWWGTGLTMLQRLR